MSSAPFDSRLTGRSLALGVLDGHGRDALPLDGQTMVPMSYRTVRSVQWHRRSWGAVGGASSPHMERGTAPGSPNRNVLRYTVSIKPAWLGCHHAPRLSVCRTRTRRSGGYPFEQFETGLADKAKGG